ncbi:protein-lysine N-methyltransferase SMYD4 isoform X2 [Parambassis ranga]|uniref:Protein-lysine N-methyltransferase SMYD4 n=1 Tax=Parambassis ranga TaxID=210632 RepID=A0A6P7JJY7_9TELE|nr:SET and MYND domain-containing protein 4 isoform X2 [Parambassis ranga]
MMDLPCLQWQDHVAQKWTRLYPELKETFTSLLEIDDVFQCALSLTTQDDLDFLQSMSAGYSVQKDAEQAAQCRERGNSSFKTRNYTEAALHYSQGVCFAPQSSEQLSLCYANRSAALYHLHNYKECLNDIDNALKNGYPSHLQHKLHDRRALCVNYLSAQEKANEDDHNPASVNPKGSDRVPASPLGPDTFGICPQTNVGYNVEKGRHLVAVETIAAGEVILIDRPYSCVLIPGMEEVKGKGGQQDAETEVLFGTEHRRCHFCLTETLSPVPCEGCSYSRYCSTSCQQEAWEEHHRWECPLAADLMVMGVMSQLALRVTLKAGMKNVQKAREQIGDEQKMSAPSCLNSDSYLRVFHLLHHINRQSPHLRFLCAVTIATLYLKLSQAGPPPISWNLSSPTAAISQSAEHVPCTTDWKSEQLLMGSAVLRHVLQLKCNAQAVITMQDTGTANLPVQSSCEIRIATAIFPTLSLLNHSCCPNTSLAFSTGSTAKPSDLSAHICGSKDEHRNKDHGPGAVIVTVRANKVIGPGQEILHCYGPHSSRMVTKERQHLLYEQYHFLCQCEACSQQQQEEVKEGRQQCSGTRGSPHKSGLLCFKCKGSLKKSTENGEPMFLCSRSSCGHRMSPSDVSRRLQEMRVNLETAHGLMERDRPGEALRLLERTRSESGLILEETHPLQGELADATARAYATMGDWNNAASHLEQSAAAIGAQYGEDSIELGRQLFKLAQLHFNGGARGPALSVIPKVRRLLCLHCGPHCHELQELKAMEQCLRGQS